LQGRYLNDWALLWGSIFIFANVGSEFSLVIRYISGFKILKIIFCDAVRILYIDVNAFVILNSTSKGNLSVG